MSWDEEDQRYPKQAEKFNRARQRYVLHGTPVDTLAHMLELPLNALRQRALDEKWDTLRIEQLKTSSAEAQEMFKVEATVGDDPLDRHIESADKAEQLGLQYLIALMNAETKAEDVKLLRSKIEAYSRGVEGLEKAIELSRKTRGIANNAPSKPQKAVETHVVYEVEVVPARAAEAS